MDGQTQSIPEDIFHAMRVCVMMGFAYTYNRRFPNERPDEVDSKYHNFARKHKDIALTIVVDLEPVSYGDALTIGAGSDQWLKLCDQIHAMYVDIPIQGHISLLRQYLPDNPLYNPLYNALRKHPHQKHAIIWAIFFVCIQPHHINENMKYVLLSLESLNPILYFDVIVKYHTQRFVDEIITFNQTSWNKSSCLMATKAKILNPLYVQLEKLLKIRDNLERYQTFNTPHLTKNNNRDVLDELNFKINSNLSEIRILNDTLNCHMITVVTKKTNTKTH
jgi:hypothetical protein